MSTVVYPLTASETQQDIENVCTNIGGFYIPENSEYYATIIKCSGSLPSTINLPNSGDVDGTALVGGLYPTQTPKTS